MSAKSRKSLAVLTEDLQAHPAMSAWRGATSLRTTPAAVHVFRERPRKALYWLPGLAPDGTAVFAKRAVAARTVLERTMYEEILPRLPLSAPHYYGSWLDEPDGWLFLEDVGAQPFSQRDPRHRALAAHWIGTLHVEAIRLPAANSLPDAGPGRYLEHLCAARERIGSSLRHWPYPQAEVAVLDALLALCDAIEGRWAHVQAACAEAPVTVVHGDFQPKNAYVKTNGAATSLCPIDWEKVGLGPPAPDLTRIDLDAYWSVVRPAWPGMRRDDIERLAGFGRLFELLAAVRWESQSLKFEDAFTRSWAVTCLGSWLGRLEEAARFTGILEARVA